MPPTRELSVTYGSLTIGGSTARQITDWTIEEASWDVSAFECEFVTSAADDASFAAELIAVRNAFRTPRQDFTMLQNAATFLSWKQSNNTGLDANPRIIKDGDPADTGRSRHFRIRIEFGQPADQISSLNFRRYATISVSYDSSRRRTVTIQGQYTANSTDGVTGSFAQYRGQITTYGTSVTSGIDGSATWEIIGEPTVERNDTDKVTTFTIVFRESIHNQSSAGLDDPSIVDPVMTITRERIAPGDSTTGGFSFAGSVGSSFSGGPNGNTTGGSGDVTGTSNPTSGGMPGQTVTLKRPTKITITYTCGIDNTRTRNIANFWTTTLRPFLMAEAKRVAGDAVILIREDPGFEDYGNRIDAEMEFIAYTGVDKFEQKITISEKTAFGKVLVPITSKNPYAYYEIAGPALRQRITNITYKQKVGSADPNTILDSLAVELASSVIGLNPADSWMPISNSPAVGCLVQGTDANAIYAEVSIERVAQRRDKVTASVANAGGVTGAGLT